MEMNCTYCGYHNAFFRPKDLDDLRRACSWCVVKLPDSDLFETILMGGCSDLDWEVLQWTR